jgi:hypothetical protein
MSISRTVYVGPYAQWLVKERVDRRALSNLLQSQDGALCSNALGLSSEPPEVEAEGGSRLCYCFVPDAHRPRQPQRELWFIGPPEVKRNAEMDWFTSAFAPENQALAKFFAKPPTIRWGLVWAS